MGAYSRSLPIGAYQTATPRVLMHVPFRCVLEVDVMVKLDRDLRLRRYEVLLAKCGDKELVKSLDLLLAAVAEKLERRTRPRGTPAKRRARTTRAAEGRRSP